MLPEKPRTPLQVDGFGEKHASATAAPNQAARWLLGRIKDGSQRFLLMQQAPSMARDVSQHPFVSSERPNSTPLVNSKGVDFRSNGSQTHSARSGSKESPTKKIQGPPIRSTYLTHCSNLPSNAQWTKTSSLGKTSVTPSGEGTVSSVYCSVKKASGKVKPPSQVIKPDIASRLRSLGQGAPLKSDVTVQSAQTCLAGGLPDQVCHRGHCEPRQQEGQQKNLSINPTHVFRAALPAHWQRNPENIGHPHTQNSSAAPLTLGRLGGKQQQAPPTFEQQGNCKTTGLVGSVQPSHSIHRETIPQAQPSLKWPQASHLEHRSVEQRSAKEEHHQQNVADLSASRSDEVFNSVQKPRNGQGSHLEQRNRFEQEAVPQATHPNILHGQPLQMSECLNHQCPSPSPHEQSTVEQSVAAYPPTCRSQTADYSTAESRLPHHGALFGKLSAEQLHVVNAPPECSVCVLAGPGAGRPDSMTSLTYHLC